MTLESTGGGQLTLTKWKSPRFETKIPPWGGDYTVSVFGRTIGLKYGFFGEASGGGSASLNRTKRDCQDDVCWSGGIQLSASFTGGIFGEIPDPLVPEKCGPTGDKRCAFLKIEGAGSSGLNAQFSVACDKVTGQFGHNGFSVSGTVILLEGGWFEVKASKVFTPLDPGPLGPLEFNLPL